MSGSGCGSEGETAAEAERPKGSGGRAYHLDTEPDSIAARCLLVGSPERAGLIATTLFDEARLVGNHRGLLSYTGTRDGTPVSVVTTGMGSASAGIVVPEAISCGAKVLIRVGSCGALWPEVELGDALICSAAVRLDGASDNWVPEGYPAVADYRVVTALKAAAVRLGKRHHVGIGATTTCFNEGQARPDLRDYVPPRLLERHRELVARGVLFYSMEEATLFTWCSAHGGYPCGAVDAAYALRMRDHDNFATVGDADAAQIAIAAILALDPDAMLVEQPLRPLVRV